MRGRGEGSIFKRADGYWVAAIEAGRYPSGGRRRLRAVRAKHKDAVEALDELRRRARVPATRGSRQTVAAYLEWWLVNVVEGHVSDGTAADYANSVARIVPHIGHVRLERLTAQQCQHVANALGERYASKTRRSTLGVLRQALRWAQRAGMLTTNPAEAVTVPRTPVAKTDDALTADEIRRVLEVAKDHEWHALFWLALRYGLRFGELQRLRWSDVGQDLIVRRAKTAAGVRSLPLLDDARVVLAEHRRQQTITSIDGLVFCRPDGRAISRQRVGEAWHALLIEAGLAPRRFHATRHSAATALLEAGVPLEVTSAILGHANITITADVYAKVRGDLQRRGLEKLS